jgi:hypothetical protein
MQHWTGNIPRDLFDIRNLIHEVGYFTDIKEGIIFSFLCGKRPIHKLLNPHYIDQSAVFESHFQGMADNTGSPAKPCVVLCDRVCLYQATMQVYTWNTHGFTGDPILAYAVGLTRMDSTHSDVVRVRHTLTFVFAD